MFPFVMLAAAIVAKRNREAQELDDWDGECDDEDSEDGWGDLTDRELDISIRRGTIGLVVLWSVIAILVGIGVIVLVRVFGNTGV
jgi:hypothetical protein